MKKKIKDLTLGEQKKICKSYKTGCEDCPLFTFNFICHTNPEDYSDNELEYEIEVEDEEIH